MECLYQVHCCKIVEPFLNLSSLSKKNCYKTVIVLEKAFFKVLYNGYIFPALIVIVHT